MNKVLRYVRKTVEAMLFVFLVMAVFPFTGYAAGNIAISDENYFPDENYRKYLTQNIDSNGDGILSQTELEATETIDCTGANISVINHLELFPYLKHLRCGNNQLKELDVSENPALVSLNCYGNSLETLKLSASGDLQELYCYSNKLKALDVTPFSGLKILRCEKNYSLELTLGYHPDLGTLYYYNESSSAPAESVDISGCAKLTNAYVYGDRSTASEYYCTYSTDASEGGAHLYLHKNMQVLVGDDYSGFLADGSVLLDPSNFSSDMLFALRVLDNGDGRLSEGELNSITRLDLAWCDDLRGIEYIRNLQDLRVGMDYSSTSDLNKLDVSQNSKLQRLTVYHTKLTELNLAGLTELNELYVNSTGIKTIDVAGCSKLKELIASNDCDALTTLKTGGCSALEVVVVSARGDNGHLKTFDFSGNKALKRVGLTVGPSITSLDFSNRSSLESFSVIGDGLSNIKVAGCKNLYYLSIDRVAPLKKLDLSGLPSLRDLICHHSGIEWLDISDSPLLVRVRKEGSADADNGQFFNRYDGEYDGVTVRLWLDAAIKLVGFDKEESSSKPAQEDSNPGQGTTNTGTKPAVKAGYQLNTAKKTAAYTGKGISSATVTIPATIKVGSTVYKVTEIAAKALKKNKKVTKVVIGSNVTKIGKEAFSGCAKLKNVTIGKNVSSIGAKAFKDCKALKKITVKSSVLTAKKVGSKAFKGTPAKVTVKVPKKVKKAYKKWLVKKGISKKAKIK